MLLPCLPLLLAYAAGQDTPPPTPAEVATKEAVQRVIQLRDEFKKSGDPVLVAWATTQLADLVCSVDRSVGTGLFREALARFRDLPENAFDTAPTPLAVESATALWNLLIPQAKECAPRERWDDRQVDAKVRFEVGKANLWLSRALETADPKRVVQLARAALGVSRATRQGNAVEHRRRILALPPGVRGVAGGSGGLDLALYNQVLAKQARDWPELSDALFQEAMKRWTAGRAPLATGLAELGRYLFTAGSSITFPIPPNIQIGNVDLPTLPDFQSARLTGDVDLARAWIGEVVRMAQNYESTSADPEGSYALVYQMPHLAQQYALEHVGALENARRLLEVQVGEESSSIRARLRPAPPEAIGAVTPENAYLAVGAARSALRDRRTGAARAFLSGVSEGDVRRQVEDLIAFTEAAVSLPSTATARLLEKPLYPVAGAKRALLYLSVAPIAENREVAIEALRMAWEDLQTLPASERLCLLPALAAAALPRDPKVALLVLAEAVRAANDAGPLQSPNGAPPLRCSDGPHEAVAAKEGRLSFGLTVPRVSAFSIQAFLAQAKPLDPARLETVVAGLRNETQRASALIAIAALRIAALH